MRIVAKCKHHNDGPVIVADEREGIELFSSVAVLRPEDDGEANEFELRMDNLYCVNGQWDHLFYFEVYDFNGNLVATIEDNLGIDSGPQPTEDAGEVVTEQLGRYEMVTDVDGCGN